MVFINIIFIVLLFSFLPNVLLSYRRVVRSKFWWSYAWSGHAIVLGIAALVSNIPWLILLSATTLITIGIGLVNLLLFFSIENRKLMFDLRTWLLVFCSHLTMGLIGIWMLLKTIPSSTDLIIVYAILFCYYIFMFNKLNVKWILYSPSKLESGLRKRIIQIVILVTYVALPLVKLL